MSATVTSIGEERMRRMTGWRTQRECIEFAAAEARAALGVPAPEALSICARGLVRGLFGPAFFAASAEQRAKWIEMAEQAMRPSKDTQP